MNSFRSLFLLCLLFGFSLVAQDSNANGTEDDAAASENETPTLLEKMTVVAERGPTKIKDTAVTVAVVSEKQVREQVATNSADLMRYEPGVFVSRDTTRLGLNGFNIRGIGANRVLTQVDGVRTAEQFAFGPLSVHQFQIDVDLIKSLEVVKSAGSSLYGSDALGGVVAFRTLDPVDVLGPGGKDQAFRFKTGYNSDFSAVQAGVTAAFDLSNWQLMAHATWRDTQERENQGDIDTEDASRTLPNDQDGNSTQFLLKAVRNLSDNNQFKVTAEIYDSTMDTDVFSGQGVSNIFGALTTISDNTAEDNQQRGRFSLEQHWQPSDVAAFDSLHWQISFSRSETDQTTVERRESSRGPVTTRIVRTGTMEMDQEFLSGDLTLRKTWNHRHTLTYGLSLDFQSFEQLRDRRDLDLDSGNPDAYAGTLIFPTRYFPKSDVTEIGAYLQWESRFWNDRIKVVPGLRYDNYDLSPDENDTIYLESTQNASTPEGLDDGAVTPKLGVNVDLTENLTVSGLVAEGFRAPPHSSVNSGFTNLTSGYQTLPNPNLDPESSLNTEFSLSGLFQRGMFRVTYFDNEFEDFINDTAFVGVSDQGILQFQPQNIENVNISGWEFKGDLMLTQQLRLRGAFTDIEGEDEDSGVDLSSIEPRRWVAGLHYNEPNGVWQAALMVSDIAEKDDGFVTPDSAEPDPFLPDGATVVDLTVGWNILQGLSLNAGIFNLTDETYWEWSQVQGRSNTSTTLDRYSEPGANWRVHLHYNW
ncbi:TonB-dependent hemoglobin/transferrin/lactoferrin family receptor [Sulfidibacter corallicola]|uniref:TonB-dependent hemoglobin/transferrin/lactoferrin family receptor n=1 Tax=Sulfidibacter corallicola TaxID=2818388 RepID=A0A8A4TMC2_SULCO|nr:TonB-dependent hemoglobin/transferrin/lactoferrin family receptor [Sulfidibacter corallicola]QTD50354.1 TonB-dependent hemoglobin/transferrin/lactoferrin family receptor [Sulfidibacter corallicola]